MGDFETLTMEPRDENFVLICDDGEGHKAEITLSEGGVVALGRLAPTVSRRILASKSPVGSDVARLAAATVVNFDIGPDLHKSLVLLKLRDEHLAEFDFAFAPSGAHALAEKLVRFADQIEGSVHPTRQ